MIEEDGPKRKEINMERRLSLRKVSKNDVLDVKNSKKSDAFDPKITISRTSLISRNCKVYKRRWLMLALFVLYSTSNAMQWIQYSIIENVIVRFYGISSSYVEWTSMVYMVSYIILIVPGSWALDKFGLRKCVLAGALGTCLGSWLKVFSTSPESFPIGFFGHSIVAVSQVFVLSVPARLAAVWFGQDQVSSACSIGVFGNQLGVALGFLIPPSVVPDVEDTNVIEGRLGLLFKSVAGFTSILLVLIIFLYEEQPPLPPSQAALKQKEETPDFVGSIKRLLSNFGYILLLVSYGINVGVFYALSTLLNKVITTHFENASADAGRIGLTIVLLGTLGSCLSGFVLDKTHKFKEVTLVVYLFSLIGLIVYNSTLDAGYISIVYVTAGFLGFFMTGYLPVGFELAAELTYPEPEGTSVGILNGFCQIFGILFTLGYSAAIESFGTRNAGWGLAATLALGTLMTYFIPKNYRRQESGKDEKEGA